MCVFLFGNVEHLFAQNDDTPQLRVIEVEPSPNDVLRDDIDNYDDNGELGAGIIIESNLSSLSIQANNGFARTPVKDGNIYSMVVSANERVITVSADGFFPIEIILTDVGVRLESGKFWKIKLTGDRANVNIPVNFVVSETGYSLYLDGNLTEYSQGTPLQVSEGQHVIRIEKIGFDPFVIDTLIDSNTNFFQVSLLETQRLNVEFSTNPSGATVSIDGNPLPAQTQDGVVLREPLYPGTYQVSVTRFGYRQFNQQIRVDENQTQFNFTLQKNAGYVVVNSQTPAAQVIIEGTPYDIGEAIELAPRTVPYGVFLRSTGYDEYEENVIVTLGDTTFIDQELSQITGDLIVRVLPNDANVVLTREGETRPVREFQGTLSLDNIPAGNYVITASKTNFREERQTFELTRDELQNINFNLVQIDGVGSLTIRSIEGSTVSLSGPTSRSFTNFPANVASLPFGFYTVKASKKGFKKVNEQFEFRSVSDELNVAQFFEPKTKGGAFTRSLLFPGAGHWYLNRKRGTLYFLGQAALIGLSVTSFGELSTAAEDLKIAKEDYATATSDFDALFQARQTAFQSQQDAKDQLTLMLTGLAALKGLELVDILIFTKNPKREFDRLQTSAGPGFVSMRVNF